MKFPVLLPKIFNYPFTYKSDLKLKVGDYVIVPFGKSKVTGVVWNEFEKEKNKKFIVKNEDIPKEGRNVKRNPVYKFSYPWRRLLRELLQTKPFRM